MHTTSQNILEIIKQVALQDIPPLTDEALTEIADALFVEHDKTEAQDAEAKSRGSLVKGLYP